MIYIRGVQTFFSEGQIQKNKQRAGPHTRGDILTHEYCVFTTWLVTQGLNIKRNTNKQFRF